MIYSLTFVIAGVVRGCAPTPGITPCHNDESRCAGANICVCDHELCNDVCNHSTTTKTATIEILILTAASLRLLIHLMGSRFWIEISFKIEKYQ